MVKAATEKKHKLKGYFEGFESEGKKTTMPAKAAAFLLPHIILMQGVFSILNENSGQSRLSRQLFAVLENAAFHFRAEMTHESLDRPRAGVAVRADRMPFDLLADIDQHADMYAVTRLAMANAGDIVAPTCAIASITMKGSKSGFR